ncbi:MAG: DUF4830 domain-containing protein [Clostridiales bacterium]|nr:MAG: DUF4830 domain-containing protein [Clostridiales bacterium]
MFVYSIRSATIKFICAIVLSVAVLITLVALIPTYADDAEPTSSISYSKIYENSDRINFISQFGWEVKETPVEEVEVTVPESFDKVYLGYNEMQKEQGLNLSKYKGKTVTRYTYEVTNYPDYDGTVYISLLVYKDKVIGGDVCSADVNGFVHGFEAPESDA